MSKSEDTLSEEVLANLEKELGEDFDMGAPGIHAAPAPGDTTISESDNQEAGQSFTAPTFVERMKKWSTRFNRRANTQTVPDNGLKPYLDQIKSFTGFTPVMPEDPRPLLQIFHEHKIKGAVFGRKAIFKPEDGGKYKYILTQKSALYKGPGDHFQPYDAMALAQLVSLNPLAVKRGVILTGTPEKQLLLAAAIAEVNKGLKKPIKIRADQTAKASEEARATQDARWKDYLSKSPVFSTPTLDNLFDNNEPPPPSAPPPPDDEPDAPPPAAVQPSQPEPAEKVSPAKSGNGNGHGHGDTASIFSKPAKGLTEEMVVVAGNYVREHNTATQQSLIDAFDISRGKAKKILEELEERGVVTPPQMIGAVPVRQVIPA